MTEDQRSRLPPIDRDTISKDRLSDAIARRGQRSGDPVVITEEKLRIYQRYTGKNYGYWELGKALADEYAILSDSDILAIGELLQLLYLSKAAIAAETLKAQTEQKLAQQAATPEVAAQLRELAV